MQGWYFQGDVSDVMEIISGFCNLFISIGGVLVIFAVFPADGGTRGVQIERAPDLSSLKVDIKFARPNMLRGGAMLLAVGLLGNGLLGLLSVLGVT
jgi:hypothetical protein